MATATSIVKEIIPIANKRMVYGTATLAGQATTIDTGLMTIDAHGIQIVDTALPTVAVDAVHLRSNHTETAGTLTVYPAEENAATGILGTSNDTTLVSFWAIGN